MNLPKEKDFLTHIAFDSVVFGYSGEKLKILIMKYRDVDLYALPGGFVKRAENINDAVRRGLKERTGLGNIYLEQLYTFGDVNRFKPEVMKRILQANGYLPDESYWMLDRFISVAYYALINYNEVTLKPDALSDSINWYDTDNLPSLMLDHSDIVAKGLQTLRDNLERKLVGVNLLPRYFTMKELQKTYEAILGKKLRRTTFQRKILNMNILERHEKRYSGEAHKAPYLYSFKSYDTIHKLQNQ